MEQMERLYQIARRFHRLYPLAIIPGLTQTEYCTLKLIYKQNKMGVGALARHLCCSTPAVSKTLRSLEEKKLVIRNVDEKDRRNTFVELTDQGEKQIRQMKQGMREYANCIQNKMGKEKMEQLITLVEEMYQITCQVNEEWKKDEE